ncbi:MAG: Oligopeptide/dipeptide ABC transporter, ATPase subunit [Acetothermia bacterium 64_32]|nr:MAG: Oligopeptide/dipeptide ABC transporter, ATPase subunit [Acetothermia bacterium 64_32]HAF71138.1 peptide ABC transporter ATP-binding protein [Candidatus Acetothermia bacterium]
MERNMESLVQVKGLSVGFRVFEGLLRVLDGISLRIGQGERVGLVGETGCGKTTTVKSILKVLPQPPAVIFGGEVLFRGKDVLRMGRRAVHQLRRSSVAAIFQDPLQALNPVFTVGTQLSDIVRDWAAGTGKRLSKKEIFRRCVEALAQTGMPDPERIMTCYPIQLSGGMRQRVCIAEALVRPVELLLADEPTTNLDVTIQDQILRKLDELVEEKGMSILLITHSLGVVMDLTERVYIMYAGTIVEEGKTEELFTNPKHPYTQGLLKSIPKLTGEGISQGIPGRIPNYLHPPSGCRFHPRCEHVMPICTQQKPPLTESEGVACHLYRGDVR